MNAAAREIVAALNLAPLPAEGGFFRATWRSTTGSAIYFLMTPENFSALHRIAQDEIWHFYSGDPIEHLQLDPREGSAHLARLGPAFLAGDLPQVVVPAGVWQGARPVVDGRHGYSLVCCTVSPAWDERGFALGARAPLSRDFPTQQNLIAALTR